MKIPDRIATWFDTANSKLILLGGFAIVIFLGLLPAMYSQWAENRSAGFVNRFIDVDHKIADLSLTSITRMIKVRRNEKDFLLTYRDFGFDEAKARYITTLLGIISEIKQNMKTVRELTTDPEIVGRTKEIDRSLDRYQTDVMSYVDLYGVRGTQNSGLEYRLTVLSRGIEGLLSVENNERLMIDFLSLRMNERNFMLNDLDIHFANAQKAWGRFRTDIRTSTMTEARKQDVLDQTQEYMLLFRRYVQITEQLRTIKTAYLASLRNVEPTLEELYQMTVDKTYKARDTIKRNSHQVKLTMIVSFVLSLLFSAIVIAFIAWKIRNTEEQMKISEARYRTLFETSPDAIAIMDRDRKILIGNQQLSTLLRYESSAEVSGKDMCDIIAPEDASIAETMLKPASGTGAVPGVEFSMLRKDRSRVVVEGAATRISDTTGGPESLIIAVRDISVRLQAEEHIRFLAAIIQNLPAGVCGIDASGRLIFWNEGAERMLGYQAGEIIGKPVADIIPQERANREQDHCISILNADGFLSGYETVRLSKSGKIVPVELTAVAIRNREQKIESYASIMVDITDRKKAEGERLKIHMLESVGLLAGGIAHDFNNLLTVIVGNIQVAQCSLKPDATEYEPLSEAEHVCMLASELTKRLITFATGGAPIMLPMPITGMLTETIGALLKGSNVTPLFDMPGDLFTVAIDEGQMKQVFRNLVINAIEAMPQGGPLDVRGENLLVTAGDNLPIQEGKYLKISIHDSGIGIPAENLAKVFDPYYSTKHTYSQKGLGLGLAVCYSVIKRHNGLITVESEPGEGTTFHIFLPAVA